MDILGLQAEFMAKAGQKVDVRDYQQADLYKDLIDEESEELRIEWILLHHGDSTLAKVAKEICDKLVVDSGFLISLLGKEKAKKAYKLVHESNMAKLEGSIIKREDGKILKNDAYKKHVKEQLMKDLAALIES